MDHPQALLLTPACREDAGRALDEIKRLERAGWIELIDYALLAQDTDGVIRVHESAGAIEPRQESITGDWMQSLVGSPHSAGHFALAGVTGGRDGERVAGGLGSHRQAT